MCSINTVSASGMSMETEHGALIHVPITPDLCNSIIFNDIANTNIKFERIQDAIDYNKLQNMYELLFKYDIVKTMISINPDLYILKFYSDSIKLHKNSINNVCNLLNIKFTYSDICIIKRFIHLLYDMNRNGNNIFINYKHNFSPSEEQIYHSGLNVANTLKLLIYGQMTISNILNFITNIESIEITLLYQCPDAEISVTLFNYPIILCIDFDNTHVLLHKK